MPVDMILLLADMAVQFGFQIIMTREEKLCLKITAESIREIRNQWKKITGPSCRERRKWMRWAWVFWLLFFLEYRPSSEGGAEGQDSEHNSTQVGSQVPAKDGDPETTLWDGQRLQMAASLEYRQTRNCREDVMRSLLVPGRSWSLTSNHTDPELDYIGLGWGVSVLLLPKASIKKTTLSEAPSPLLS